MGKALTCWGELLGCRHRHLCCLRRRPSVFPDSRVENPGFEIPNVLFRTDFKSETTSKYILDIPGVFPDNFSYIKYYFLMKIGQNQSTSRKPSPHNFWG